MEFDKLLRLVVEKGASDLFITAQRPPSMKINGKIQIKMTDYGIDPPAPKIALGLITVGDEIDLTFEWHTQKK